jgi:hypothetical protein
MRQAAPLSLIASLAAILVVIGLACSENSSQPVDDGEDPNGNNEDPLSAACMSCHGDEERLQATATPDSSSGEEPSGEG